MGRAFLISCWSTCVHIKRKLLGRRRRRTRSRKASRRKVGATCAWVMRVNVWVMVSFFFISVEARYQNTRGAWTSFTYLFVEYGSKKMDSRRSRIVLYLVSGYEVMPSTRRFISVMSLIFSKQTPPVNTYMTSKLLSCSEYITNN